MGNHQSLTCSNCTKHLKKMQRGGHHCIICQRPHCTSCSNREKISLLTEDKVKKRRICHTCAISIDNANNEIRMSISEPLQSSKGLTNSELVPDFSDQLNSSNIIFNNSMVIQMKDQDNDFEQSIISKPQRSQMTVSVRFNNELNMYEGLPKTWRQILEMPPQAREVEKIDESLQIEKKKVIKYEKAYEYEVQEREKSGSFLISKKKRKVVNPECDFKFQIVGSAEETQFYEVNFDKKKGFTGLPQELEDQLYAADFEIDQIQKNPAQVLEILQFNNNGGYNQHQEPLPLPGDFDYIQVVLNSNLFKADNPATYYNIIRQIGTGGYGKIYLVTKKDDLQEYALKFINQPVNNTKQNAAIRNEIALMSICDHENIVKYIDGYMFKERYWIFLEYMDAGCLADVLEAGFFQAFTEKIIQYVVYETFQALQYLHHKHIIHRDIKSDNILLNSNGEIKLGDFGYAAQLTRERGQRKSKVGTVCWMAPEVIKGVEMYTGKIDVWSTGIMILEFVFGEPPYLHQPMSQVCYQILTANPPELDHKKYSPVMRDFVKVCLTKDPSLRPTVDELLLHPFMNQMNYERCKKDFLRFMQLYQESKTNVEIVFESSPLNQSGLH